MTSAAWTKALTGQKRSKPVRSPRPPSAGEALFDMHCVCHKLYPVREFVFAEGRRWRFDFAWPDQKIAVEIEGGTRVNGRHSRHAGFEADARKYNRAILLGWRVMRYTTDMVKNGEAIDDIAAMLGQDAVPSVRIEEM